MRLDMDMGTGRDTATAMHPGNTIITMTRGTGMNDFIPPDLGIAGHLRSALARVICTIGVIGASLIPLPVAAIDASREVVAAAELTGTDRGERLLAKARAEGTLNPYATMGQEQISVLAAEFEKNYFVNPAELVKQSEKWSRLYQQVFAGAAR